MVAHPVLPSLREHDLCFMLKDVASRMIFVPAEFRGQHCAQMLAHVVQKLDAPPLVVVVRGACGPHIAYSALLQNITPSPLPVLDPDAVRMIMYTSGTTGSPKGVMHSHNSIHALIRQIGRHWRVEPGDKFLVASPISHFAGATPFLVQLLAAAKRGGTRLPDIKLFVCGGASVPPSLIREATDYFERAVVTRVYGSTEVPVTTVGVTDCNDAAHAADTDGRAGIASIRLVDANGATAATGEVVAQGPQMLVGYIHPKEVEDLLVDHPDIAEIAIVGLTDPRTGERACAVIVPRGSARPDVDSLSAFLDALGVAKFKMPEQVAIWDTLPKNEAGKVLKHQIREVLVRASS